MVQGVEIRVKVCCNSDEVVRIVSQCLQDGHRVELDSVPLVIVDLWLIAFTDQDCMKRELAARQ